jgi:arginine:ornithine antiporter/lysine permease
MLSSGGAKFLMLSALLYVPGTILFVIARREQQRPVFTRVEWLLFGVVAAVAAAGIYGLTTGAISV